MRSALHSTRVTLEMIKWEHSIFALPFALTGAVLAAGGWPPLRVLGWIIVCMVSARSAAMAFNRLADAEIDAVNPRTAARAIPAGLVSRGFVITFTIFASAVFFLGAAMLNHLTLELAPLALAIVFAYSYMKRVTRWSHLILGLSLESLPQLRGSRFAVHSLKGLLLTAIVLLWVGGFDVLYACQDFEHDRRVGLYSVPQAFGLRGAFWMARTMHAGMAVLLFVMLRAFGLGPVALIGVVVCVALLAYEHAIVAPGDLRRLNAAFFTLNGVISVVLFVFIAADVLHRR